MAAQGEPSGPPAVAWSSGPEHSNTSCGWFIAWGDNLPSLPAGDISPGGPGEDQGGAEAGDQLAGDPGGGRGRGRARPRRAG